MLSTTPSKNHGSLVYTLGGQGDGNWEGRIYGNWEGRIPPGGGQSDSFSKQARTPPLARLVEACGPIGPPRFLWSLRFISKIN